MSQIVQIHSSVFGIAVQVGVGAEHAVSHGLLTDAEVVVDVMKESTAVVGGRDGAAHALFSCFQHEIGLSRGLQFMANRWRI